MAADAILNLFEPEIAPFYSPSQKTHYRTKHEVDRMIRCGDMAIRIFRNERSVVGRSVVNIRTYIDLILLFATLGT